MLDSLNTGFFYHSPRDIFIKFLSTIPKEDNLNTNKSKALNEAVKAFNLYDFQKIAASELIKRLKKYQIALLADPVGAGKTLSALGVASVYNNIVIIAPKNLIPQWESYFITENMQDYNLKSFIDNMKFRVRILSYHQAQEKSKEKIGFLQSAELIIIDESHNFRNGEPRTTSKKQNRYQKLRSNLNPKAKILLLSATPINNNYLDLANQLCLKSKYITNTKNPSFKLDPKNICLKAKKAHEDALSNNKEINLNDNYYALTELIFSRSSKQIINYLKALNKDMPKQHITRHYCSSVPPHIEFNFDSLSNLLGIEKSTDENTSISFSIYDPYKFLPKDIRDSYDKQIENLGEYTTPRGFICMKLLKALESSIDAFLPIIQKIIDYHHSYLTTLKAPNEEKYNDYDDEEEIKEENSFPTSLKKLDENNHLNMLSPEFEKVVKKDLAILESIAKKFENYNSKMDFKETPKYKQLCEIINSIPQIRKQKLLIFTESIPTAKVISDTLKESYPNLCIESLTGDSDTKSFVRIKSRFSPKSLKASLSTQDREIDILVATDVLSEGANLQDCQNLLNWDIAFNPVRSIQRIGRIWRIGSSHKENYITHFFPDTDINSYIQLESKLKFKITVAQTATSIDDPHALKNAKDAKMFEERRARAYEAMDSENIENSIIEENEFNKFSTIESYLKELSYNLHYDTLDSTLPDGIFSIANDSTLPYHHLFALLQDLDSKKYYYALYDLKTNSLHPSVYHKDNIENLYRIDILKDSDSIDRAAFETLENISNNYRNLSFLKEIFKSLTNELESQIKEHQKQIDKTKTSDCGLISVIEIKFKLVAWLLLNPDFKLLESLNKG
ncbi:DEAD/DEAH box helicase [Helicobacter sp. MIT 14-3879]|uniref:DEAD/DEAH box helicase n=1 Tax=Helicobacter sp. MIT 14-3879 TaxID=2040649 RepID=UPI0021614DB5|nr:DEAD/DEAH box helicase [Helicobacter sp. MIT 14-3879]